MEASNQPTNLVKERDVQIRGDGMEREPPPLERVILKQDADGGKHGSLRGSVDTGANGLSQHSRTGSTRSSLATP